MRRRGIQFIVLWAIVLSTTAMTYGVEYAGGTGEPNDPYLIATAEQLRQTDFTVPETYFRLCNDIDLDRDSPWIPHFRAYLDGAGFEIQNVVMPTGPAFIGFLEPEGTVANLTLVGLDVGAAQDQYGSGWGLVGGLTMLNDGTISNCAVIGWVATWKIHGVGGLVGGNRGTIINSYFDGWVDASWWRATDEYEDSIPIVGGLASYNAGWITNSFARGFVVGGEGVGGLVGYNSGMINNCYSLCTVLGEVGAGGLVSENKGSLRNCYAIGRVTGEMRGGLVGMAGTYLGSATNCLWDMYRTDCWRSGAGIGVSSLVGSSLYTLSFNGWAGDPNWVVPVGLSRDDSYPRLAWEGVEGAMVPEYAHSKFSEGRGTESNPYVIRDREALRGLHELSIYWDKHFVLANDLDMYGSGPAPIGICPGSSFSGVFDGNGHVIRNPRYGADDKDWPMWNCGLFGHVTGEVRNLTIENSRLFGGKNSRRIGLLAGTNDGIIRNCSVSGSITVGENSQYIGQLLGVNNGQVIDCNATATIQAGEGSTDIGGQIGADFPPL